MQTFADYILNEEDFEKKVEIMYYLQRKTNIFFDNTVVFKAMIAKMFIETMNIDIDKNLIITTMLLCECKKVDIAQDIEKIKSYAKESADYLASLGFPKHFCKICEEHNRYSGSFPREKESHILELVDQFGGMLLDREERQAFPIDEALVLLEHRNLKDYNNIYLEKFKEFINIIKEINV